MARAPDVLMQMQIPAPRCRICFGVQVANGWTNPPLLEIVRNDTHGGGPRMCDDMFCPACGARYRFEARVEFVHGGRQK